MLVCRLALPLRRRASLGSGFQQQPMQEAGHSVAKTDKQSQVWDKALSCSSSIVEPYASCNQAACSQPVMQGCIRPAMATASPPHVLLTLQPAAEHVAVAVAGTPADWQNAAPSQVEPIELDALQEAGHAYAAPVDAHLRLLSLGG